MLTGSNKQCRINAGEENHPDVIPFLAACNSKAAAGTSYRLLATGMLASSSGYNFRQPDVAAGKGSYSSRQKETCQQAAADITADMSRHDRILLQA